MKTPNPMGCARCGIDRRGHAIQAGSDGSHTWQAPTQQQIKERMLARRTVSDRAQPAEQDECHAARYVSVADSYDGSSLCGCDNCRERTAELDSEGGC